MTHNYKGHTIANFILLTNLVYKVQSITVLDFENKKHLIKKKKSAAKLQKGLQEYTQQL